MKVTTSTTASLRPLLTIIKRPRVVTSAAPPTNHCEDAGPTHKAPPAQLPDRLCQTTGATPSEVITKESLFTGNRKTST